MRYPAEHKAQIHQKIVEDASQRFRGGGLDGPGVAAVMQASGLTHGGFYKHFRNKDELLRESISEAFLDVGAELTQLAEQAPAGEGWKAIVKWYLSLEHCHHPETGCALAALAPELARSAPEMKKRILADMVKYEDSLLKFMPGKSAKDRERAFFVIIPAMVGVIEFARMMPNEAARQRVLDINRDFLLASF